MEAASDARDTKDKIFRAQYEREQERNSVSALRFMAIVARADAKEKARVDHSEAHERKLEHIEADLKMKMAQQSLGI